MFPPNKKNNTGYTLVEMLITVLIFGMIAGLVFSSLSFFSQISHLNGDSSEYDQRYEKIHAYLQRQIEGTDHVYIDQWGKVYLLDMESPEYYDVYELKGRQIYRSKYHIVETESGNHQKNDISNYPLEDRITFYCLTAETNVQGYTGNLILEIRFEDYGEKEYQSIISVPERKNQFKEIHIMEGTP